MRRDAVTSIAMAALIAACVAAPQRQPLLHVQHTSEARDSRVPRPTAVSSAVDGLKRPLSSKLLAHTHSSVPAGYVRPIIIAPPRQISVATPHFAVSVSSRHTQQSIDARVLYIAGHTKNTDNKGAFSASGIREHVYNDLMLEAIKRVTAGSDSIYVPSSLDLLLRERPGLPQRRGVHIYVELHHDTGFSKDVARKAWSELSGYSVFYSRNSLCANESALLAGAIGKAMREYGLKPSVYYTRGVQAQHKVSVDRRNGVYESDFFVLKNSRVPAVLVECGNIANPHEESLLDSRRTMTAGAIREGVLSYLCR